MSILIKGMSMPPNDGRGRRAFITRRDDELDLIVETVIELDDRHMDVYPLVEVPEPHGDLIDRDALRKEHAQAESGVYGGRYAVGENRFMQRFEAASTVIGAEAPEEEEDE